MAQLVITNIEEDIVASYIRNIQGRLSELLQDVECQTTNREELFEKIKAIEKQLKNVYHTLR